MADELEPVDPNLGISRRDLMRKGAVLGGTVLWAAPVVQSFTTPAFASGTPVQGAGDISYVAVLVQCGTNCFVVKYETDGTTECTTVTGAKVPCCQPFSTTSTGCLTSNCPENLGTFSEGSDGTVTYTPPEGCVVVDYRVHCGQCCEGPGAPNQPLLGVGGSLTFVQCTGVGNTNHPCATVGNQSAPCSSSQHPALTHLEP